MTDNGTKQLAKRVFVTTLVVLGIALILYLMYLARKPLLWIGIAAFLAIAINPLVHKTKKYMPKHNIALAAVVVLLLLCLIGGALIWIFFAPFVQQTINLISAIPELIGKINNSLSKTPLAGSTTINQQSIKSYLGSNAGRLVNTASQLVGILLAFIIGVIDAVVAIVSILSLMFFMTVEGKALKNFTIKLFRPNHRDKALELGRKVYDIINGYVVGNFTVSMIFGAFSIVALWLLKSPYFLVLGVVAGLIDLIPLVGTTIAAILIGIIFVLSGQPWAAVAYMVFSFVYVQFENTVINPAVYSKNVSVSPLIVLVSILIGATIAGIIGALLAIPVAATLKVIINELYKSRLATTSDSV